MKSSKVLALIIGAIALFPSASFAGENVTGNSQEANLNSTTVGHGNVGVTTTSQEILNLQKAKKHGTNVSGTSQKVNADTTTVGSYNTDIKDAAQKAINLQQAK
jgi:hypothetical protein